MVAHPTWRLLMPSGVRFGMAVLVRNGLRTGGAQERYEFLKDIMGDMRCVLGFKWMIGNGCSVNGTI